MARLQALMLMMPLKVGAQAVDIFRAAPTSPSFFRTLPIRDETGRLCEVRFYKNDTAQQPLAVVAIADDGALLPLQWL